MVPKNCLSGICGIKGQLSITEILKLILHEVRLVFHHLCHTSLHFFSVTGLKFAETWGMGYANVTLPALIG